MHMNTTQKKQTRFSPDKGVSWSVRDDLLCPKHIDQHDPGCTDETGLWYVGRCGLWWCWPAQICRRIFWSLESDLRSLRGGQPSKLPVPVTWTFLQCLLERLYVLGWCSWWTGSGLRITEQKQKSHPALPADCGFHSLRLKWETHLPARVRVDNLAKRLTEASSVCWLTDCPTVTAICLQTRC